MAVQKAGGDYDNLKATNTTLRNAALSDKFTNSATIAHTFRRNDLTYWRQAGERVDVLLLDTSAHVDFADNVSQSVVELNPILLRCSSPHVNQIHRRNTCLLCHYQCHLPDRDALGLSAVCRYQCPLGLPVGFHQSTA